MQWPATVDWECPSGKLLTELGEVIPRDRVTPILLFGSAALQMTVAPNVLSADMDIAPDIAKKPLGNDKAKRDKGGR